MAAAFAVLLLSCGDAMVEPSFRGAPLFEFRGQVQVVSGFDEGEHDIRVGLFWLPQGPNSLQRTWQEQPSASVRIEFPSTFTIKIFQPPKSEHYYQAHQAVARILLYDDLDHDGHWSPDEPLVGDAPDASIAYIEPEAAEISFAGVGLPTGFSLLRTPIRCFTRVSDRFQCDLPLGAPCTEHTDCCLAEDCSDARVACITEERAMRSVPGGYCVVLEGSRFCSRLEPQSEISGTLGYGITVQGGRRALGLGCRSDDDCRPEYRCEAAHRVCLPDTSVVLLLDERYLPRTICRECVSDGEHADRCLDPTGREWPPPDVDMRGGR